MARSSNNRPKNAKSIIQRQSAQLKSMRILFLFFKIIIIFILLLGVVVGFYENEPFIWICCFVLWELSLFIFLSADLLLFSSEIKLSLLNYTYIISEMLNKPQNINTEK